MELSEYIKSSLGTFSPNPDDWTLIQRLGLEWGKQAFQLEERVRELSLLPEDAKRWLHAGDCTRINKQACTCGLAQYIHALGGE